MMNMNRWESAVDRAIRQAMEDGEFTNLPGEGQPLDLNDDPNTPPDLQLAYKIMRDNGIAPDWVAQGGELEARQTGWRTRLNAAQVEYKRSGNAETWAAARTTLSEELDTLNRAILSYNLKLPPGIAHRPAMNMTRELERLGVV